MTGMPEAVLARELAIPYAAINVVANYAAGRGDSRDGHLHGRHSHRPGRGDAAGTCDYREDADER
jgi:purine nucleoside phosphorylase